MSLFRRLSSLSSVLVASALVLFTGGPALMAQSDTSLMRDPTVTRGSLFGSSAGPRIIHLPERRQAPVRRVLQPSPTVRAPASEPVIARAKVEPTTFVVVLGDTLAELLANGLDEALADVPTAAVIKRSRADSGLVRQDFHDWPRTARELLASSEPITAAVILVGANDRQPIREGEVTHEPLSERWRELYRERIDAITQEFAERRVPLVWVGAPPMQNARLSADLLVLNELYRQRVERAGGVYVDLWQGFVDGENRYAATGPDMSGQAARLRTNDGVHFTRAGARKAAHFVDVALRRALPGLSDGPALALPGPVPPILPAAPGLAGPVEQAAPVAPPSVETIIDQIARQGLGLEPVPMAVIPVKPVAGPVTPLTGPALAPRGVLMPTLATARGQGAAAQEIERVFGEGRPPLPVPGRADDFRWPRP